MRSRRQPRFGLAALLVLAVGAAPRAAPAFDLDVLAGPVIEEYVRGVEAEKRALTGPERKIDHELRWMLGHSIAPPSSGPGPQAPSPDTELRVSIHLRSAEADDVRDLGRCGLALERLDRDTMRAEGRARLADIERLAELPCVTALRPVHPGWLRVGAATTEGDVASRAPLVRAQGYDGSGIAVGVISDGVDHAAQARSTGDLPSITIPADPRCQRGSGDEGTALLEIVHDLAPGARLLFSSGSASEMTFIDSVRCLAAAGANVIVDDLGFFEQPFFEDGSIASAVKTVIRGGVSYHSAAGNEAGVHLEQMYRASPDMGFHDFLGEPGKVDETNDVSVGTLGTLTCILQWNDPFGAAADDYDLFVFDANLKLLAASTNSQTGTEDPLEEVSVRAPVSQTFKVAIRKAAGESRLLSLFCLSGAGQQYVTPTGSIIGHPALEEAVAVGAINVSDSGLDTVESYSSEGPAGIFFPAPETRAKPDIAAFDGVSISNAGGFPRCPPFCRFFGTSAAAPHSAAVAALLLSKNPFLTPPDIQDALRATAVDIGSAGPDDDSGAGRLDALAAADAIQPPECAARTATSARRTRASAGHASTRESPTARPATTATPARGPTGVRWVCARARMRSSARHLISATTPPATRRPAPAQAPPSPTAAPATTARRARGPTPARAACVGETPSSASRPTSATRSASATRRRAPARTPRNPTAAPATTATRVRGPTPVGAARAPAATPSCATTIMSRARTMRATRNEVASIRHSPV